METIMPFFQWCDSSWLGSAMRGSRVAFPIVENIHLFALTVLLGTLIILSLRQFGALYAAVPLQELAVQLRPWYLWSLVVMLASGILLFLSEAMKCYGNTSFRVKMIFLFAALIFQFTAYNRVVKNQGQSPTTSGKVSAAVALCLWFGVGLAGRAIGFLG